MSTADEGVPLCVDLDGTLIAGDTLVISVRLLLQRQPWALAVAALALLRGRAAFKAAVAQRVVPEAAQLPWRAAVVDWVRAQRAAGRRVYLATAAHERVAQAVSAYLGCFDGTIASDGSTNARGATKVDAIRAALRTKAFDYVGDSTADIPVLLAARRGYLVAPSAALLAAVGAHPGVSTLLDAR